MKKIINDPEQVVDEMLTGMVMAHPEIVRVNGFNVLIRKESKKKDKVTLISGGGSGHEPAHGGFIGYGMLDAAVSGEVFTSPTPDQILEAIKAVDTGKGSLLIVKNYSGDVMNFEMASEMAEMDGIEIEQVIINDDVAVEDSTYTTGRRGIAGTIFVHKIAGAMAEKGASLSEVKRVAQKAINNLRSKGMALTSCTVPSVGKPTFEIAEDEMEVGLGIHGEPGVEKIKIKSAAEIAENLVDSIVEDLPFKSGDEVALLINGLGSTPLMELYILNKSVQDLCRKRGIKVYKTYVDEYMTSLEMAGASISMLKLDDELKELLDEPADTLVLKQGGKKDD
ncbi:dihydroxyacetone kinase subunit DhaK [Iocasia frigidifontis]|uniref:phosphoenolpyruvate--glycerone phosphotransferase n=1 Tax=Iocasia fonsfrigidae TaxID=2682810 RepID=A0A8A7KCJ1_9FIRM|nr:dihydroxyacetone kinase subunit DhaK [Iocasia fonsfrigidae]QTL99573.1 dihydroxyacetone kinase subunit DhaK [Iocasia fonsfrigidae]